MASFVFFDILKWDIWYWYKFYIEEMLQKLLIIWIFLEKSEEAFLDVDYDPSKWWLSITIKHFFWINLRVKFLLLHVDQRRCWPKHLLPFRCERNFLIHILIIWLPGAEGLILCTFKKYEILKLIFVYVSKKRAIQKTRLKLKSET